MNGSTPEQEARARETAHDIMRADRRDDGSCRHASDWAQEACDRLVAFILAEREKLDGALRGFEAQRLAYLAADAFLGDAQRERDAAVAALDGARAAALREAAEVCRDRARYYGAPMPRSARTVVEKTAEACCLDIADALEALAANPQTTEEGPRMKILDVMASECPRCEAGPSRRCRFYNGKPRTAHRERVELAQERADIPTPPTSAATTGRETP